MNDVIDTPKVSLDRSRDIATVHGDRTPDDLHAKVRFYQDGLPFDAEGFLIADHPDIKKNEKLQKVIERKLKKAAAKAEREAARARGELDDDDEEERADADGKLPPVDLRAWIMGQKDYIWTEVSQAIALKYKVRVGSNKHAVEFLVGEGVVIPELVAKKYHKYMD